MDDSLVKIALGGGCHWCTEAVFQALIAVEKVNQGYVASQEENTSFSEAVIVTFNSEKISLRTLIEIHLRTHKSTSNHSMRTKYRSAIYYFSEAQKLEITQILEELQPKFEHKLITKTLVFQEFKPSRDEIKNYYFTNPERPFCKTFIKPKLRLLLTQFSKQIDHSKIAKSKISTL